MIKTSLAASLPELLFDVGWRLEGQSAGIYLAQRYISGTVRNLLLYRGFGRGKEILKCDFSHRR